MLEFELSVAVPPTHIGPLLVAPVDDGTGLTVIIFVAVAVIEQLPVGLVYVAVTVFVPDVSQVTVAEYEPVPPVIV